MIKVGDFLNLAITLDLYDLDFLMDHWTKSQRKTKKQRKWTVV